MSDEEFKEISALLKLSGGDEAFKREVDRYIENADAVLGFEAENGEKEGFSLLSPDEAKTSAERSTVLENSKGRDGEYFCLPERGQIF